MLTPRLILAEHRKSFTLFDKIAKVLKEGGKNLNGILSAYKPKGPTSHDVVDEVRRKTGIKKVGHAGTLDPFARGVLLIGVGRRATRVLDFLKSEKKIYWVKMKLGLITETFDITGEVKEENPCHVSSEEILEAVRSFVGEYEQVPPAYSARKYKGKKLYELARQGKIIRLPPKKVKIFKIWDIKVVYPTVTFRAEVSPGTYIRSLCMDIGYKLGCGATAVELVREKVGDFYIENTINPFEATPDDIAKHLIPIEKALMKYPSVILAQKGVAKILNGGQPFLEDIIETQGDFEKGDIIKLLDGEGKIVALAEAERSSKFLKTLERMGRNERIAKLMRVLGE